jgi:hypothetical protein
VLTGIVALVAICRCGAGGFERALLKSSARNCAADSGRRCGMISSAAANRRTSAAASGGDIAHRPGMAAPEQTRCPRDGPVDSEQLAVPVLGLHDAVLARRTGCISAVVRSALAPLAPLGDTLVLAAAAPPEHGNRPGFDSAGCAAPGRALLSSAPSCRARPSSAMASLRRACHGCPGPTRRDRARRSPMAAASREKRGLRTAWVVGRRASLVFVLCDMWRHRSLAQI